MRPMTILAVAITLLMAGVPPADAASTPPPRNATHIIHIIIDNLRPALGAYGYVPVAHSDAVANFTPRLDALARSDGATLFAKAFCQLSWCAPSRNSFLTGRRPDVTKAWNFVNSFRDTSPTEWASLPGYLKGKGYYATSCGKVMHPHLPPNFDYPASWSDEPYFLAKPNCPNNTMSCEFDSNFTDADARTADACIGRMRAWSQRYARNATAAGPLYLAVGFQGPRLPWSFPAAAAARVPRASALALPAHAGATPDPFPGNASVPAAFEWFRPTEVDQFSDLHSGKHGSITRARPLDGDATRRVRHAYYAAAAHADAAAGRVLDALAALPAGIGDDAAVLVQADHGQSLGEHNLWSMMGLLDESLQVPLIARLPPSAAAAAASASGAGGQPARVYDGPVELVDVFATLAGLAGHPLPPPGPGRAGPLAGVAGRDLGPILRGEEGGGDDDAAAFSQITRCRNCSRAYPGDGADYGVASCGYDARADPATKYTVPCAKTPRAAFDWMGYSVRTRAWRYSLWCAWDGARLAPDWRNCTGDELFDHRGDVDLPPYAPDRVENENLAGAPALAATQAALRARLVAAFSSGAANGGDRTTRHIRATDPMIRFEGRTQATADGGGVVYDMPGVALVARFTGSGGLAGRWRQAGIGEPHAQADYFVVFCDGVAQPGGRFGSTFNTTNWAPSPAVATVPLCAGLDPSTAHDVRVLKSTEAQWNSLVPAPNYVTFLGLTGDSGLTLLAPPPRSARRLEFLGDSITAGFCNLCGDAGTTSGPDEQSVAHAWPNLVCQTLGAECHTAAWSGYGVVENCCGGKTLMSDVWLRTLASEPSPNASDPHGTAKGNYWDFSRWMPDAVVINLGTNDELNVRPANVEAYNRTYLALVTAAAAAYGPATHFFLACGPMSTSYCGEVRWVLGSLAAAGVKASFLDQRGFLDGRFGPACCGHPSVEVDVAMARNTSATIAHVMGWREGVDGIDGLQ